MKAQLAYWQFIVKGQRVMSGKTCMGIYCLAARASLRKCSPCLKRELIEKAIPKAETPCREAHPRIVVRCSRLQKGIERNEKRRYMKPSGNTDTVCEVEIVVGLHHSTGGRMVCAGWNKANRTAK